jgi:hypothetical protein
MNDRSIPPRQRLDVKSACDANQCPRQDDPPCKQIVLTGHFCSSLRPLPHCVATIASTTPSATSGDLALATCVKSCKTAVERSAPQLGAIPCSICGTRSVERSRDDDGRRQDDETKHHCLSRRILGTPLNQTRKLTATFGQRIERRPPKPAGRWPQLTLGG